MMTQTYVVIWQPLERVCAEQTEFRAASLDDAWQRARDVIPEDAYILDVYGAS